MQDPPRPSGHLWLDGATTSLGTPPQVGLSVAKPTGRTRGGKAGEPLAAQDLLAFVSVADSLSFTKAARKLGIAQQLVSARIARLERDLHVQLFERDTRHVQLSGPGLRLYEDARDILDRMEYARRNVTLAAQGHSGHLAIGCGDYAVETVLPTLLQQFRDKYPDVTLTLYEQRTAAQVEALRNREIDIGLALLPPESPDLNIEVLREEGFVVAQARRGRTAHAEPVALSAYKDAPFVATPRSRSPGLEDMRDRMFSEAGFIPNIVQYATEPLTLLALVAAGIGVLLCPAALGQINSRNIDFVPLKSSHRVRLTMITLRAAVQSPAMLNFCALARDLRL